MFWIVILILLGIFAAQFDNEPRNYDCYDKSPYKCGNCRKNCKWKYIVKKFEESENNK